VKKLSNLLLLVALLALVAATQGCGVINKLRAKDSLNEGVRDFNKGKYEEAEGKFKHALDLSPEMLNAQLFYARALNARFEQSLTESLGLETIKAYDNIIKMNPTDQEAKDRALAFKANVYKQLGSVSVEKTDQYKDMQHKTLLERIELPGAKPQAKADVYYTIGVDMWQNSYSQNAQYVSKKQPIPPQVQEKMKPNIQKAHEYLQRALSVDPDYANAYYYETLTLREDAKVTSDPAKLKEIDKKIQEGLDMYKKIQDKQKQAAAQAAPTATDAAK
jgi:tetratricopeptide (TPR) repeat protein